MNKEDPFLKLTWEMLEKWAGVRVVSRGKKYQEQGAVGSLWRIEEGDVIARVQGGVTTTLPGLLIKTKN